MFSTIHLFSILDNLFMPLVTPAGEISVHHTQHGGSVRRELDHSGWRGTGSGVGSRVGEVGKGGGKLGDGGVRGWGLGRTLTCLVCYVVLLIHLGWDHRQRGRAYSRVRVGMCIH
jgi:hypothetical protein